MKAPSTTETAHLLSGLIDSLFYFQSLLTISDHWIPPRCYITAEMNKQSHPWDRSFPSTPSPLSSCKCSALAAVEMVRSHFRCAHMHSCRVCLVISLPLTLFLLPHFKKHNCSWESLEGQTLKHFISPCAPKLDLLSEMSACVARCRGGEPWWKCQQGRVQRERASFKLNSKQNFHQSSNNVFYSCLKRCLHAVLILWCSLAGVL